MQPIILTDPSSGSNARIASHLGFNCFSFQAVVDGETIDVIDAADDFASGNQRPSSHGIPLLFPFPNRIRGGSYTWEGREYRLPESEVTFDNAGNAIHGFCLDRPWRVTSSGENFAVGEFQLSQDAPERLPYWPSDFLIEVRYELRDSTLRADIRIANPDTKPMPWGFGTHPYFRLPLSPHSKPKHCVIQAPAGEQWELDDCLPTGVRRTIEPEKDLREGVYFDQIKLDDVLTGLNESSDGMECQIIDERAGLQISQFSDSQYRELVVFTPPGRNAVCLEPYTCLTDAINLQNQEIDAGLRVMPPGAEIRTWIEIRASQVIA